MPSFYVLQSPFTPRQKDISVIEIEMSLGIESKNYDDKLKRIASQLELFANVIQEDVDDGILEILNPMDMVKYALDEMQRHERGESRRIGVFVLPDGSQILISLTDKGAELATEHGMEPYTLLGMRVMNRLSNAIEATGDASTTLKSKQLEGGGASFSLFSNLIPKDPKEYDAESE